MQELLSDPVVPAPASGLETLLAQLILLTVSSNPNHTIAKQIPTPTKTVAWTHLQPIHLPPISSLVNDIETNKTIKNGVHLTVR